MKARRGILAGLWLLSLAAISFYGGAVSYGLFFGVTLIPVISLIYLLCVYARFKIYQETGKRSMVCGQPESYLFVLQNEDFFAYTGISVRMHSDFSYVEESFENVEYELLPGDKSTFETRIVCRYRGEYEIGIKEVVITDLFRLFRLRYTVSGQIKAQVFPKVMPLEELKSIADLPVFLQADHAGGAEPDILVRDYAEGDSLKQIHWKATAREQKLKTRILTGKENQKIFIFCDTKRCSKNMKEYLPLENKILEIFLAVGFFFAEKGRVFQALYGQNGTVRQQVEDKNGFQAFYNKVSEICFDESEDVSRILGQAAESGSMWGNPIVFCILHELSPSVLEITERLSSGGVPVVIYVVSDREPENCRKLSSMRRKVIVLPIEGELEGRL